MGISAFQRGDSGLALCVYSPEPGDPGPLHFGITDAQGGFVVCFFLQAPCR